MYSKENVELFLLAREDGMSIKGAAAFAKVNYNAAKDWIYKGLPHSYTASKGGVGRPKSGRVGPGFDLEQEQVRARREIEAGDRAAPPLDHRFLEDIEELL